MHSCAGSSASASPAPLAKAEPKALRWALWHTPGRLVAHARTLTVRIIDGWPGADTLLGAYDRIAAIC